MRQTRFPDDVVAQDIKIASVLYDFETDGGAEGEIPLVGTMPAGALVMGGYLHVEVPLADDGGEIPGDLSIQLEAAGDIIAVTASDNTLWADVGRKDLVPIGTDQLTWVQTTQERNLVLVVAGADLTDGRFWVHMLYHVPQTSADALSR